MAKSGKYSLKERLNIQEHYENFLSMAPREQILVGAGIVVALLLVIVIPIACGSSYLSKLQKRIDSNEKNVGQVISKIGEYNLTKEKLKSIEGDIKPGSQVQLRTKIEALANAGSINGNIDSANERTNPGEEFEEWLVDVKMTKLSLSQVVEFIFNVENQKDLKLKVSRLTLNPRYDNRQLFDVSFTASTLVKKDKDKDSGNK